MNDMDNLGNPSWKVVYMAEAGATGNRSCTAPGIGQSSNAANDHPPLARGQLWGKGGAAGLRIAGNKLLAPAPNQPVSSPVQ